MAIRNRTVIMSPIKHYGMRGDAPSGKYFPAVTDGTLVGGNPGGTVVWSDSFCFQNFMYQSSGWLEDTGTGAYTIDLQDNITQLEGTRTLRKEVSVNASSDVLPPGGTYRLRWNGDGELAVGRGGVMELDWNSSNDATFTHLTAGNLYVFARGGTVSNIELLPPNFVEGQYFWTPWLDFFLSCAPPVIRFMDWGNTNGSYLRNWEDRTLPSASGWLRSIKWGSHLGDTNNGSYRGQVPIEAMVQLCNIAGAHMWYCIPTRATDDYATKCAALIRQILRPDLLVYVEYTNETFNGDPAFGSPFGDTHYWVCYLDANKRRGDGANGSPTITSPAHGLTNGQTIVLIPHEEAEQDRGNTSIPWGTAQAVSNVTTNTFDLPFNLDTGHRVIWWFPTSETPVGTPSERITKVDHNTGWRSVELWDAFKAGFQDDSRVVEVIAGQGNFTQRCLNRVDAQGTNGRYDLFAVSVYYDGTFVPGTSTQQWQYGDSLAQMGVYDDEALTAFLEYTDAQIAAGLTPICAYECGSHIVSNNLTGAPSNEARDAFFAEYELSAYRQANFQRLYTEMANRNFQVACQFVMDVGAGFSQYGQWSIQLGYDNLPQAKYSVILGMNGFAEKSDVEPPLTAYEPQYMLTFIGADGSAIPTVLNNGFLRGGWEQRGGKLRGINPQTPEGTAYNRSWLVGVDAEMTYGEMHMVINANGESGDEAGFLLRGIDAFNFLDVINLNGTIRAFSIIDSNVGVLDGGAGYVIPGYSNTADYLLSVYIWGNQFTVYVNGVLALSFTTTIHSTGTIFGIKSSNGLNQTYDNMFLPHFYTQPLTTATIYWSRHSKIDHIFVGEGVAPVSEYTQCENWSPLIAAASGVTLNIPDTRFGNVGNINDIWQSEGVPASWGTNTYTHYLAMPPSFVQNWANDPFPNQSPSHWAAEFNEYVGRVLATGQNPEMLIFEPDAYARHVVGAYPVDDTNLTFDEFARWRQFMRTTGMEWYRDMINELGSLRPNVKFRLIPFAHVFSALTEESYLINVPWNQYFGDSAPHGRETAYFLTSLVLHRAIYGTDANMAGFVFPTGHNVIAEVRNNLTPIVTKIGELMDYFHNDPASPYKGWVY